MKQPDEQWWSRAREARDRLAEQFSAHPAVTLIDIGLDPSAAHDTPVLRVHTRAGLAAPPVPDRLGGIPICVIHGEYTIQRRVDETGGDQ